MKRYSPTVGEAMHEGEDGDWVCFEEVRMLLLESKRTHYVCEDCWYSCPESGECCDEREKGCNCGAAEWNAKVDAALANAPSGMRATMIRIKKSWIEAEWTLDGIRSWGFLYAVNPYWRRERRARLHIKLYWLAMWVDVPWKHSEPKGYGTAARMWGPSWWPALGTGPTLYWGWSFYKPWLSK